MKRIKTKKISKPLLLSITILFIIVTVYILLNQINKKVSPIIMNYAVLEAKKLSSIIINKSISKHITESINPEDMFTITKDSNGEIRQVDFNTPLVNKFLTETTNSVQINLRNIEQGNIDALEFTDSVLVDYDRKKLEQGIICEISSGVITGNAVLANVGPKIPIKITLIGDATSNISTNIKDYGINNALIEVFVNIKITEKVLLPFYSEPIEIETKVPVALKIVTGVVPKYYSNGLSKETPSVIVDTEDNLHT